VTQFEPPLGDSGLRGRILAGGGALIARQGYVRVLQIAGTIALARILTPQDFGFYVMVSLFVTLLGTIGDLGVAGSLIQRSEDPTEHELASAFGLQAALALGLGGLMLLLAGILTALLGLPSDAANLLRLLAVASIITGLRTIPTVLMERHLEFGRLAIAEAAQASVFQGTAVTLAVLGRGVLSFGIAAVFASLTAAVLVYLLRPWRPRISFDRSVMRSLLLFGLPYQGAGFVSFVKDALNPLFVGSLSGPVTVGLVNWASTLVTYPLLVLSVMNRLYFPAFARLRMFPGRLEPIAEAVIRWNVSVAVATLIPYVLAAPFWTTVIFGSQWLPAVPVVYLLAATVPLAAAAAPGMSVLNAFGRSDVVFAFTFAWMAISWIVGVPAILAFGMVGYGIASVVVTCSAPLFFAAVKRSLNFAIWPSVLAALGAAVVAWAGRWIAVMLFPAMTGQLPTELLLVALEVSVYAATWALLLGTRLRQDLRLIRSPDLALDRNQSSIA
jgi:O-antigen/teichoic acid export membrane protein